MLSYPYNHQSSSMEDFEKDFSEEMEVDFFDHLPDPILLLIFNKILDGKSLCRCLAVSKRFASLVPEVDSLSIEFNSSKSKKPSSDAPNSRTGSSLVSKNNSFIRSFVVKPFQLLRQFLGKKLSSSSSSSSKDGAIIDVFNWVGTTLKSFREIQSIKLVLPCYGGEIGVNKSIPLLKWEAGFGKELERCVILGATSVYERREKMVANEGVGCQAEENGNDDDPLFTDEELKMRIIWIISCLIASSARHNLMKKVVNDCPKLSFASISDTGKQGMLCMDAGQIRELRDSMKGAVTNNENNSAESQMGYVGNLVMKLWYMKELDLPSGLVMKGATLVEIRPDRKEREMEEREREGDGLSLRRVFEGDEVFGEAAKELLKRKEKRVYRLEMNSF